MKAKHLRELSSFTQRPIETLSYDQLRRYEELATCRLADITRRIEQVKEQCKLAQLEASMNGWRQYAPD